MYIHLPYQKHKAMYTFADLLKYYQTENPVIAAELSARQHECQTENRYQTLHQVFFYAVPKHTTHEYMIEIWALMDKKL